MKRLSKSELHSQVKNLLDNKAQQEGFKDFIDWFIVLRKEFKSAAGRPHLYDLPYITLVILQRSLKNEIK